MTRVSYHQIKMHSRISPKHVASQTPGDVLDRCSICGSAVQKKKLANRIAREEGRDGILRFKRVEENMLIK